MTNDPDIDPRLLTIGEGIRAHLQCSITVEGENIIAGTFAVIGISEDTGKVCTSFYRECHPLMAVTLVLVILMHVPSDSIEFSACFIPDVRGILIFEDEPGFDLVRIQHLRDVLGLGVSKVYSS